MLMLNSYLCGDCGIESECYTGTTYNHGKSHEVLAVCKKCDSSNMKKVFKPLKIASSNGMFSSKVPDGFKTILNHHAKRAGSLNKIHNVGIGEM